MQEYIQSPYGVKKKDLIFPVTKNYLYHEINRGCHASGVKRIRVHDIRHPYVKHTTKNKSLQKQKSQAIKEF